MQKMGSKITHHFRQLASTVDFYGYERQENQMDLAIQPSDIRKKYDWETYE